ncbi:MAG: IS110 family transposase [Bryobacteraceae bacterium]
MSKQKPRPAAAKIDWKALSLVHPDAAGIDIGGHEHWVAIAPERDEQPVRCFGCFTAEIEQMAEWLLACGIRSVAMQSTGVYWLPVFEILEQHGLEVWLVNARHTKNLPGRKSDIAECQWILKLHTFGLLNKSFQPGDAVRTMRTPWRHRAGLVAQAASAIQRMQKTLVETNIQLSNVLSDLSGVGGMAILSAILAGERDPKTLAALADPQVKASRKGIAESLHGNWRPELLFVLDQEMAAYRECQAKIRACDERLRKHLQSMESRLDPDEKPLGPRPKGKRARGNAPKFDLRAELYRLTGVDWSQVDGIDVRVAQTVIAEVGTSLDAFPTEKHFAKWLGLAPCNDTSGGKVLNRRTPKVVSRAKVAFRNAANSLRHSRSYLGAQFRRFGTRMGDPKALTIMARKLACLFYRLLTQGRQYVDKGAAYYEARYREQQVRSVLKRAAQLGLTVLLPPAGQSA